jgi:cell division protein ZapA
MDRSGRDDSRVKRPISVTVANQRFQLKTEANPAYVRRLAAYVDEKLDEARRSGRTVATQSLALLAAMNIADELLQLRDSHEALKRDVRDRSRRILEYLASVTADSEAR